MQPIRLSRTLIVCCAVVFAAICQTAVAGTLCVNPAGSHNCFSSIQAAVNHASANDLIKVDAGTYKEEVDIGIPLAIIGAGAHASIIDATGLAHGIFVDGFDHPGLKQVTITGLTVENALFEGVLVVSASDITIQNNNIIDNDATPGLMFTGQPTGCPGQPGDGVYDLECAADVASGRLRRDLQPHQTRQRRRHRVRGHDGQCAPVSNARAARRQQGRRVSRAGGMAGRQSVPRQPTFLDSAPVHWVARFAGGILQRTCRFRRKLL